jgi:hypothetical protein
MERPVRGLPQLLPDARALGKQSTTVWLSQEQGQDVFLLPDFCLEETIGAALCRTPQREKQPASQSARLGGWKFIRRAPALHPEFDLLPRNTHAGTLEFRKAPRVFFQRLRRPRPLAVSAHFGQIGRQSFLITNDVGKKIAHAHSTRRRSRLKEVGGRFVNFDRAWLDVHAHRLWLRTSIVEEAPQLPAP